MPFSPSDLAVVIAPRDPGPVLYRTIDRLAAQTISGFEVIVVVDSKDRVPPAGSGVEVLVEEKTGPGVARNRAVARTQRPLVLFLGDDMVPTSTLVSRHLEAHRSHPERESAVLGPIARHPEVRPNGVTRWMERTAVQFDQRMTAGPDATWTRFCSSNVSLKRDFFLEVGGYDPALEFDHEDLDFAYRAHERGLKLWWEADAVVQHLHTYDLAQIARRYASYGRGERAMGAKHHWFSADIAPRVRLADAHPPVSMLWPIAAEMLPDRWPSMKRRADELSSIWYHQHVAPNFLSAWDGEGDLAELKAYLGPAFDEQTLWTHQRALDEEMDGVGDEDRFYRTSETYLYDLTAFAMWHTKRPYFAALKKAVPAGARLLDYGCGIGVDGLRLLADGFDVSFADFVNPSTHYLRWRLAQRGSEAPVYDLEGDIPGGFDAAYAFDVIEHVDDPFDLLGQLESRASVVAVNLLEPDPDDTHLHRPLPIGKIVDRAASRGLLHYRVYHGRSHLVIYRSGGQGGWSSRLNRLRGELGRVLEPAAEITRRALVR